MMYSGKYHIDFTDFKGITEILLDSGSTDEFTMRYDIYSFNNKSLRDLLIDEVFENGKE